MAITLDGTNGINSSGVIVAPDGSASAPSITNDGDTNTGIYFPAADNIGFATGGTIRGRWTTDGLCFGSDTAAANALDDYEEGTYTATLTPNTSGTITLKTAAQTLQYTKIGRVVHVTGFLEVNSVASPVGARVELNLPFSAASGDSYAATANINSNLLGSSKAANLTWAIVVPNTTRVDLYDGSVNSVGNGSYAPNIVASTDFRVAITYFV